MHDGLLRQGQERSPFLAGGGELGRLIGGFDWRATSLGAIDGWPDLLKTTVGLILRSPVPIVTLWGEDGVMIYNDAYSVFAAGRHPALLGSKVREGWPEVADFNDHVMKTVLGRGETLSYQDQELTLHRSGAPEQVWMNLDYSPVVDDEGQPQGVIAIVVETTSKVRAERQLSGERERLRRMFEQAPGFIAMLEGSEHRFALANRAYWQLVGRRPLLGRTVAEALPEVVEQGFLQLLDSVYHSLQPHVGRATPVRIDRGGGALEERFVDFVYEPIVDETGAATGIFVQGNDVTEEQRAIRALRESELELRESESRLRIAQRAGRIGSFELLPAEGRILVSEEFCRLWGLSPCTDFETSALIDMVVPEERPALRTAGSAVDNETLSYIEYRIRRPDTGEIRWMARRGEVIEADGRKRYLGVSYDITDRKAAELALERFNETLEAQVAERTRELEEAQEALRQAQKMEAIGQLTGGIAHDFNNLLTGVIGSLDMLQRRIAAGQLDQVERYTSAAQGAAKRAAALTHRLLAFARRQPLDPKTVDANRLVTAMGDLLHRTIGETVELEIVTAGGLWLTRCDPHQLESAILNLAINARDAMPGGGKLTIETCNTHLDSAYAARDREVKPGQYVCICVTDTGTGMPRDVLRRAFDPFFTTKPTGQGTGLGLSMVYGFARQSEGFARIYSEEGSGTTIKIYLPRFYGRQEAAEEEEAPFEQRPAEAREKVVLVVEDEESVRSLVVELLDEMGYKVLEAHDGPSGLRLLQSDAHIDLLISDVGLPGLNGRQLADAARQKRPELLVLFITGYAENAAIAGGFLEPGMEMITKPFAVDAMARRVSNLLAGG